MFVIIMSASGHWKAYGNERTIQSIIEPNTTQWTFQTIRGHPDSAHTCYGTNSTASTDPADMTSHFLLDPQPHFCRGGFCSVAVEYLHSWDTSYIAAASCQLYTVDRQRNTLSAP